MNDNTHRSQKVTVSTIKNLLNDNPRLAEALQLHVLRRTRFKNLRQLEVLSGFDRKELKELGIIETYSRGAYIIIDRLNSETWIISEDIDTKEAEELLRNSLQELEKNGVEMPVSSDTDELISNCLDNMGMFNDVAAQVRFEDEGFESVSEEEFAYPMVIRMSKGFKIPDSVKPKLNKALDNFEIDVSFADRYWSVQQDPKSGVFTTISSETEGHHRLIYPKAREKDLTEEEIGSLLLEMEETMTRNGLVDVTVDEAIEKIRKEDQKSEV